MHVDLLYVCCLIILFTVEVALALFGACVAMVMTDAFNAATSGRGEDLDEDVGSWDFPSAPWETKRQEGGGGLL